MTPSRPPLGPSLSFPEPSTSTSLVAKFQVAKRRIASTSTLEFFAPAAKSFQPLPYTPHAPYGQSENRSRAFSTRHQSRTHDSLALPGMDPQPNDPDVVFIHPPFTAFPNSDQHPEGLSYQLMADNPDWFLDPTDFISPGNTNPQAIPYPNILEPPRGWCPAKKKDLKERGSEGWPEGEEPRLRCTFCRRTYAGVNAKSMWRRHVYEKHKIAMSNRRDGNDRPREENKQVTSTAPRERERAREEQHDRVLNLQVAPQTDPENVSHKSRFRSTMKAADTREPKEKKVTICLPPSITAASHKKPSKEDLENTPVDSDIRHSTPPTSPQPTLSSDNDAVSKPEVIEASTSTSNLLASPYDPLATPSFRHSPGQLPSDRPWRFGSPNHPLHLPTKDYSLSMLAVCDTSSPLVKLPITLGSSPPVPSSPSSTPLDSFLKTPSTSNISAKGFPRSWLVKGPLGSPLEKHTKRTFKDFSPLSRSTFGSGSHRRTPGRSDDWLTGDLDLAPFQTPWPAILSDDGSPSKRTQPFIEPESPVVRRATSSTVELGIGLLDPFVLEDEPPTVDEIEAEINALAGSKRERRNSVGPIKQHPSPEPLESSPPLKKRRLSSD
ncbi:hypothetical protein CC1G_06791 [Coprinopsis cinerea okayama7|uniref:Uncharacterized protein n=1 Tax=Coprinopsis cinerea (strain Okayama-7 / 130 / ATCC MYA-4618 / FGSC 9003) TaxID=240176 RepID=A8N1R3_COPC7|nr:hypothetical protein CC1G_06791 [Coprinopsis cinerea okayama7\|eukprot:XP_001828805.2 hypothetical protein CC1G_06791 [Coprinopsis cinerea okayama7\